MYAYLVKKIVVFFIVTLLAYNFAPTFYNDIANIIASYTGQTRETIDSWTIVDRVIKELATRL